MHAAWLWLPHQYLLFNQNIVMYCAELVVTEYMSTWGGWGQGWSGQDSVRFGGEMLQKVEDGVKNLGFVFVWFFFGEGNWANGAEIWVWWEKWWEMVKYLLNCKYFWHFSHFPVRESCCFFPFLAYISVCFSLSHILFSDKYFSD